MKIAISILSVFSIINPKKYSLIILGNSIWLIIRAFHYILYTNLIAVTLSLFLIPSIIRGLILLSLGIFLLIFYISEEKMKHKK